MVNVPTGLSNLKTTVEDIDVCKLNIFPIYLKKLSDVVSKEIVKKAKLNTLNAKPNNLEKEILDATTLLHINQYNTTTIFFLNGDFENNILDFSDLVTTVALKKKIGEIENKITDFSGLDKKLVYDVKISEIERKYFTTTNYNKFTSGILDSKIKQKELVTKSNISNIVKDSDFNRKLKALVTKAELKSEQAKIMTLKTHDLNNFLGHICFGDYGLQNMFFFIN